MSETDGSIWFHRNDLFRVPERILATMEEDGDDPDRIRVTFRKPHFTAVMQNCTSSATRKRMWMAKEKRFPENVERLEKIIVPRDEMARLLGFSNHAELKMKEKMSGSVGDVVARLMDL